MLLGAVMIAAAVTLRRWLASGPDGARAGFSGERVRGREADMLSAVAQASALVHPHAAGAEPVRSGADRSSDLVEGGRSGGGGASGKF
jgi:hypothetical protein